MLHNRFSQHHSSDDVGIQPTDPAQADDIAELLSSGSVALPATFASTVTEPYNGAPTLVCRQHRYGTPTADMKETTVFCERQLPDAVHTLTLKVPCVGMNALGMTGKACRYDTTGRQSGYLIFAFTLELLPETREQQKTVAHIANDLTTAFTEHGTPGVCSFIEKKLPAVIAHSSCTRREYPPDHQALGEDRTQDVSDPVAGFAEALAEYARAAGNRWKLPEDGDAHRVSYCTAGSSSFGQVVLCLQHLSHGGHLAVELAIEADQMDDSAFVIRSLSLTNLNRWLLADRYRVSNLERLNRVAGSASDPAFWQRLVDTLTESAALHGNSNIEKTPLFRQLSPFSPVPDSFFTKIKRFAQQLFQRDKQV